MPWQRIAAVVSPDRAERVSAALEAQGALAVTLEDAGQEPLYEPPPGATPMWSATRVEGLFKASIDWEVVAGRITAELALEGTAWRCERLEDQAWERVWMERFRPMRFGARLWICPTAHPTPPEALVPIALDPGLAFGTGSHPTTALCLEAVDRIDPGGFQVVDYGCGSGVLAIAALLLGAERCIALDIDPQALTASRENAARNGVTGRLFATGDASLIPPAAADLLMANILAGPLMALAPRLVALLRPGGTLVLSGILAAQVEHVTEAYRACVDLEVPRRRDGWVCLVGRKRARALACEDGL